MPSIGFWINNWVVLYLKDGTAGVCGEGQGEVAVCHTVSDARAGQHCHVWWHPACCWPQRATAQAAATMTTANEKPNRIAPRMAARAAAAAAAAPPWWRATWAVSPMRQSWHWNRSTWYNYRRKVATPSPSAGCGSRAKTNNIFFDSLSAALEKGTQRPNEKYIKLTIKRPQKTPKKKKSNNQRKPVKGVSKCEIP